MTRLRLLLSISPPDRLPPPLPPTCSHIPVTADKDKPSNRSARWRDSQTSLTMMGCVSLCMWVCEAQAIGKTKRENESEEGNMAYKWHLFTSNPSSPAVLGISEMLEGRKKDMGVGKTRLMREKEAHEHLEIKGGTTCADQPCISSSASAALGIARLRCPSRTAHRHFLMCLQCISFSTCVSDLIFISADGSYFKTADISG